MTGALLAAAPWILVGAYLAFGIRQPRPLPPEPARGGPWPFVSIVVPARNEARTIERCVGSLTRLDYPDFEILVVDDRSDDDTAERVRALDVGSARSLRVIPGMALPEEWFGKPWACRQGAEAARGELLLFTDADTEHGPGLLRRCLAGLEEDRASALSLVGRQELGSFSERLVQPFMFMLLGLRYPALHRPIDQERWRDAIANGQFILVRREAYEEVGGHGAVRGEVVEDLRLAQVLTRAGHRLTVRGAEDAFSTRMYTSLRELVNGWTKNVAVGARKAAGWWGGVAAPGMVVVLLGFWVLPAVLLSVGAVGGMVGAAGGTLGGMVGAAGGVLAGLGSPPVLAWAALATGCNLLIAAGLYRQFGVAAWYVLLHPVAALIVAFIAARSWVRGERRIEWKGRRYGG